MHYVYILKSLKDDKIYIGRTSNLRNRIKMHNNKENFSTKTRAPFKLIYYESYLSYKDTINREKALKQYGQGLRRLKERLKFSLYV